MGELIDDERVPGVEQCPQTVGFVVIEQTQEKQERAQIGQEQERFEAGGCGQTEGGRAPEDELRAGRIDRGKLFTVDPAVNGVVT